MLILNHTWANDVPHRAAGLSKAGKFSLNEKGVAQLISLLFSAYVAFFPDDLDFVLDHWGKPSRPSEGFVHWPTDLTRDTEPIACHSHNDYWRRVPLYEALKAGCIGVEADVWLFEDELYVGHTTSSLTPQRTLRNLYIDPLLDILQKQNPITKFHPDPEDRPQGVFDTNPDQTLVLLIDFKTTGRALWPHVYSQLEPLRTKGYLSYFNGTAVVEGPITVVATGNAPFDLLTANTTHRDIFFDAPLDEMAEPFQIALQKPSQQSRDSRIRKKGTDQGQGKTGVPETAEYSPANSYYASVSFKKSIGFPWRSRLSQTQLKLIREQIQGAHRRGLKVRYWGVPSWPRGLRNHLWHILIREGVDILNVDDLTGATRRDWRKGKGWWY
ncbi:MAG: hypothetical protein Q9227_002719 [Pyrenula ochraceoflavens]